MFVYIASDFQELRRCVVSHYLMESGLSALVLLYIMH